PGVGSFYRWQGKVEEAAEALLIIKTAAARFEAVQKRIKELHSYELPEIIAVSITAGSKEYLDWIADNTK
ncbi:MAG TPA: divalent-cation tolerance protein CutA, partial [Gammaproteobacteria bacterium]|nr:divalent-cation tolerance protein CutA [Gammaproteobacteria bacterium]